MFVAHLLCSDPACAEALAAEAHSLAELETLACACGSGFEVLGWPDAVVEGEVIVLRRRGRLSKAA